jgi:DNA replication and repair protein RecF
VRLLSLALRNYRNYARLDLEPGSRLNVFLGRNGQGKTNLLESIAILALSTSPRARRDAELIGTLAAETRIEALVEAAGRRIDLRIDYREENGRTRRRIEVAGVSRRAVDLPGVLRVVLFWPDDLSLVKSGPEHRRRLLNQLLVQVEPGHAARLARYARVLEQRNSLLKQIALGDAGTETLDVWDLELATLGSGIAAARGRVVGELAERAAAHHAAIGGERLELAYQGPPENLLDALAAGRALDIRRGTTGCGPHRDDVLVTLGGREARGFASQGQQRTAVVSVKLAEADVIEARTGEPPLLLLDDVLSELDPDRRAALMGRISAGGQVVVTSAEPGPFPEDVMSTASVRCIEAGVLVSCG